jgi:hypothetical protein
VSAKPDAGAVTNKMHGLSDAPGFAMRREPAPAPKKTVFHLRVLEAKKENIAKLIIGEPRPGIDHKLVVTQVPEVEQSGN